MLINTRTIININLNNINIERITFYKFVGVIIDDKLNWKNIEENNLIRTF